MKKLTIVLLSIVLVPLFGCNPVATVFRQTMTFPQPTASATAWLIPTPTEATSPTQESGVVQRCLEVKTLEVPMASVTTGSILLWRGLFPYTYYLHDLQSGREYRLPTQTDYSIQEAAISPDKNMLAYLEYDDMVIGTGFTKMILWVVNARAVVLAKITYDRGDLNSLRWVSNKQVLFENYLTTQEGTVMLVNPFTNEQHLLRNEMPGYFRGEVKTGLDWRVEYSPDFEWGMYVEGPDPDYPSSAILRDFVSGETIWQSQEHVGNYNVPLWSPDSEVVAYGDVGKDLYLLKRSGEASLLSSDASTQGDDYLWSPDGRYLMFWTNDSLMLYDRQANEITALCYLDDAMYHYLVWSPDSKQLDIKLAYSGYEKNLLIDMTNNTAYPLEDLQGRFYYPAIWMYSIP